MQVVDERVKLIGRHLQTRERVQDALRELFGAMADFRQKRLIKEASTKG